MAETSTPKEPVAAPDEAGNASQSINPESPADADASPAEPKPQLSFKVIHGKNSWDIVMPADSLVSDLKVKLAGVTGIHSHLQKLLWRGTRLKLELARFDVGASQFGARNIWT